MELKRPQRIKPGSQAHWDWLERAWRRKAIPPNDGSGYALEALQAETRAYWAAAAQNDPALAEALEKESEAHHG